MGMLWLVMLLSSVLQPAGHWIHARPCLLPLVSSGYFNCYLFSEFWSPYLKLHPSWSAYHYPIYLGSFIKNMYILCLFFFFIVQLPQCCPGKHLTAGSAGQNGVGWEPLCAVFASAVNILTMANCKDCCI